MKTNFDDLIVINKSDLEKEIKRLEGCKHPNLNSRDTSLISNSIRDLESILNSSKPITPFIEDAFENGEQCSAHFSKSPKLFMVTLTREEYLNEKIEW